MRTPDAEDLLIFTDEAQQPCDRRSIIRAPFRRQDRPLASHAERRIFRLDGMPGAVAVRLERGLCPQWHWLAPCPADLRRALDELSHGGAGNWWQIRALIATRRLIPSGILGRLHAKQPVQLGIDIQDRSRSS